jgi:hypothetical protein
MQLLAPDILDDARHLSPAVCLAAWAVGLLLWLLGWWGHRFWIVLAATTAAGVLGLAHGPAGVPPLVAGLLCAVAAGALALDLARVLAFLAGGLATWLVFRHAAPAWDEPLVSGLAGGLAGLLLFRLWTMALTSFAGTLLMAYAALCLADRFGKITVTDWADRNALLLNAVCGGVALLGLLFQCLLDRRARRRPPPAVVEEEEGPPEPDYPPRKRSWWGAAKRDVRRAG